MTVRDLFRQYRKTVDAEGFAAAAPAFFGTDGYLDAAAGPAARNLLDTLEDAEAAYGAGLRPDTKRCGKKLRDAVETYLNYKKHERG